MVESHLAERYLVVGASIYLVRESVWTSNDEQQPFGNRGFFLLDIFGKFHRSKFFAALVEQHNKIGFLSRSENCIPFGMFLLFKGEILGVFDIAEILYIKRNIKREAFCIFVDALREVVVGCFSHHEKSDFNCASCLVELI